MKKLILAAIISIASINLFGQIDTNKYFPHVNQYLLPQIYQGENPCMSFDLSESDYFSSGICSGITNPPNGVSIVDYAQPYYTEKPLTVIGIAALAAKGYLKDDDILKWKFGIMDTNMKSYVYIKDTITSVITKDDLKFSEHFFYEPINVKGYFYVYMQGPTPGKDGYTKHPLGTAGLYYTADKCKEPYDKFFPRTKKFIYNQQLELTSYDEEWFNATDGRVFMLFPIIGEYDPSLYVAGLNEADIAKFSNVYPNPATSEVTVQSSFNIEAIELYNMIGQLLDTKPVNAYSTSLDVSLYPKGNYTLLIRTRQGSAKKKLIVQ